MSSIRTRIVAAAVTGALAVGASALLAGAAQATTPACGNSSIQETNSPSDGATGHGSATLLFRNISHSTCTVYGYPGVDAINSSGHVLAHATRTLSGFAGGPGVEKTISIPAGQWASAVVEWMNFNPTTSGACTFGAAINSTAPNTTHVVKLPLQTSICKLQIHPVQAGTNGVWYFTLAQAEWIAGSKAIAADQKSWMAKAEHYLQVGGYSTQVSELNSLMSYPITGLTPTQITQVKKLTSELNSFFQTPGLYF